MVAYDLEYLTRPIEPPLGHSWFVGAGWTVPSMTAALDAHDRGSFCRSAAAAVRCTRFAPIYGALMQRLGPPLGLARAVRGGRRWNGKGQTEAARLDAEDVFRRSLTVGNAGAIFTSVAMMGFGIIKNEWTSDGSTWQVRACPWPASAVQKNAITGQFEAITREGIVPITHGDGVWTVIAPWGPDSHLMGAIRALGLTWIKAGFADRDEANYSDVHGRPKPIGELPPKVVPNSDEGREFAQMVKGLGTPRSGGIYPNGGKVGMLEAEGRSEKVFDQILRRGGSYVAMALVGQDGTLEKGTGVYTAPVFEGVKFSLTRAETLAAGEALTEGVARPMTLLNYGGEREDLVPTLEWLLPDLEADQRHKSYGERLETFHRVVRSARENGFSVDQEEADWIAGKLGVEAPTLRADGDPRAGEGPRART